MAAKKPASQAEHIAALEAQAKVVSRLIAAKKSKDSLLDFTRFTMPDPVDMDDVGKSLYQPALHHRAICELLEKVERGEILRALISMPPRGGKSELCSRRFPPWFVGRDPYRQVILATYSQEFADDFGRKSREIIDMPQYRQIFPNVSLRKGSRAADRMELEQGGMLAFVGAGGAVTGRGADLLLIDDPLKNREEAESLTTRNKIWDWFTSTAYTRLMPGGRIVIIMTRWHEDDIVGRIMNPAYVPKDEANKWYVLNLPAIYDEGTDQERALWPERYPLEVLKSTRAFIGARDWSALYQGNPTPPEGSYFKRDMIHTYTPEQMPNKFRSYLAGDLALGTKKQHDSSCVGDWMLDENDTLFLSPGIYWDKKPADESVEKIIDMMEFRKGTLMDTFWERGQIEKAVGPFLKKRMLERGCYTSVNALPVVGDKGIRATAIRGRMAMGKVRFPAWAPWWPRALDQLLKFTGSGDDAEDDFVDQCGLIGQALGKQLRASPDYEKQDNVIKPLTMKWVRWHTDQKENAEKRYKNRGGF